MSQILRIMAWLAPHGLVRMRDSLRTRRWKRDQDAVHAQRKTRIRSIGELPSSAEPWFDYGKALEFLRGRGFALEEVQEGSMSADRLQYCLNEMRGMLPAPPWIGLHIGNFVGVSLAFFSYVSYRAHPNSLVVAIDPNVCHRGIKSPQEAVVGLLNYFGLHRHVLCVTGYSLEKCVSNDALIFRDYDPAVFFGSEESCENVLPSLHLLAPERFNFCVIDGNHDPNYLQRELDYVHCLLRPKAVVVLDDISWQWPELEAAYASLDDARWRKVTADGRIGILQRD
jgi:hypothetical protein